jgi:hypothetical protein
MEPDGINLRLLGYAVWLHFVTLTEFPDVFTIDAKAALVINSVSQAEI